MWPGCMCREQGMHIMHQHWQHACLRGQAGPRDQEGWRGQGRILPYLFLFNAYIIEHNAVWYTIHNAGKVLVPFINNILKIVVGGGNLRYVIVAHGLLFNSVTSGSQDFPLFGIDLFQLQLPFWLASMILITAKYSHSTFNKLYIKLLTHIKAFNFYNNSMREVLLILPFYRWRKDWG